MTAQNFMNVVRFKLKSDCVDKNFEVFRLVSTHEVKPQSVELN